MKFKAFDKRTNEYIKNVVIDSDGNVHVVDYDKKLNKVIDKYYKSKGDILGGDYGVIDYTDWYGYENIIIEIVDENKNSDIVKTSDRLIPVVPKEERTRGY
ncbi:MAG: hypothetical protein M0R17_09170 [Candidatus Omnitrophica bacterium]|jgi:hypothetical protein|nr:hypothetical protein [Candidatus Omnitrophota bacterium]